MRRLRFAAIFVCVFAIAVNARAQSTAGSMSGTVVDASGNVVPGADVTVTHETSGERRSMVSNETGAFFFPALTPGPYTLTIQLAGFKTIERKNNIVLANNRLALGAMQLELAGLAEQVTVTAFSRGEVVAITQTSQQALLDTRQVANLSIRGRDPISLLKVLPGVALLANDQETFGGSFATAVPAIQGSTTGRQTIYVDGINGGDGGGQGGGGGNFSGATNLDAIAEVNVQAAAYQAEFGLKGGAQVNFVTKHGTADYHGSAYTYQRDKRFNSINYFNKIAGVPKPDYRYSTLGGTLGGPVPATNKKLLFFYSLDDTQLKDPNILRRWIMPTALERTGDFSQTRTPAGALITIRDPLTNLPFPDNKIPADRIDPRGLTLLKMLPMPNATGSGFNDLTQEASIPHPRRQHLLRVDYHIDPKDTISVKGQSWYTKSVGYNVAGASARWGLVRQRYDFTADQGKVDYTRILNPNTVLEVNSGFFSSYEDGPPEDDAALRSIQRASFPALANLPQFAAANNPLGLIPKATWGTNLQSSGSADWVPNIAYDNRWPITGHDLAFNVSANLTHTRGAHAFKFGGMREQENFQQARSGTFAGEFNFQNDAANPDNTGYAYANALLGKITSYTESMGRPPDDRLQTTYAWYAQDTWTIRSGVTLDLGLRMYKSGLPLHRSGESSIFSFDAFDPTWGGNPPVLFRPITTADGRRAMNPRTGQILPATFIGQMVPGTGYTCGVIAPTTPCRINGVVPQDNGNYVDGGEGFTQPTPIQWDPRLGVAWAITPRTVVRAAGGTFHEGSGGFYVTGGPAFRFDRVVRYTDFNSFLTGTSVTSPVDVTGTARIDKRPAVYRYSAGVQRELGWHMLLDVAFVGDQTHFLPVVKNYNQVPAGARFKPENRDVTVTPTAANPGALPDAFLRPYVGFGDISITEPNGKTSYNSIQTQLTRRFTGGIELSGAYTWARGRQNFFPNNYPANNNNMVNNANVYSNNPLPPEAAETRANVQEHVLVASYTIELPHRQGWSGPPDWLLNGWSFSGISTFATGGITGVTFTTTDSFDFNGGGERCGNRDGQYPDQSGSARISGSAQTIDHWFDTSVFSRPTGRGSLGNNCDGNIITLPGFHNHDVSLFKTFSMRGNQKMQFRWEIYNLFDQLSFNEVDTSAIFDATGRQTDTNFGKVTSARNERRMQFSLRYIF